MKASSFSRLVLITEDEYLKFINKTKAPPLFKSYKEQASNFQEERAMKRSNSNNEEEEKAIIHKIAVSLKKDKKKDIARDITTTFPKSLIAKAILVLTHLEENKGKIDFDNLIELIRYAVSETRPPRIPVPTNWADFTHQLVDTKVPRTLLSNVTVKELGLTATTRKRVQRRRPTTTSKRHRPSDESTPSKRRWIES